MDDFDLCVDLQPDYGYRYSARAYAKEYFGEIDEAILDYQKRERRFGKTSEQLT